MRLLPAATLATTLLAAGLSAAPAPIDIPYQRFVLPNGLRLIVHEDHKAPIVAVNVWYHVGSKNEKPGRTGFAHLFEHLMFNGTENYNDDYFLPLEKAGATDLNGTTNVDRTNYFQNVPVSALDMVLWMESDRMGHLLGAVDQARLDEQRGVVQNEKRQGENEPYGVVYELLTHNTYPAGHPYSWTTIGSMADLDAAKLDDVKEWFQTYYGAANAVIVIAGDVDAETARKKVEHYFGHIPSGPPVARQEKWVARMPAPHRGLVHDRVPQARLYKVWNIPEWGSPEADTLDLLARVLSSGKSSRLYKRLVYDDRTATGVSASVEAAEIGSQFHIVATAQPGGDLAAVEKAVDEEVARLLKEGPTAAEMERVQTEYRAGFVRGIERIGGFEGKSDVLAESEIYGGRPDFYKVRLDRVARATADDVRRAGAAWLDAGVYTLEVHPFPAYKTSPAAADRKAVPAPPEPPAGGLPPAQTATLSNGIKVVLAERAAVPIVNVTVLLDAGYAADRGAKAGTASLALNMLDEGTRTRSSIAISDELKRLGALLGTGSSVDASWVSLSALQENLEPSLALLADVVLNPTFPAADFERLRQLQIAQIQREKVTPVYTALRVLPQLLYGKGHAYAIGFTGSGDESSMGAMTREDLARFHETWFKASNATLVVVGATRLDAIVPQLEKAFGGWAKGPVPAKTIDPVPPRTGGAVYLIDRPGSQQSMILAGMIVPPKRNPHEIPFEIMNDVLGGTFTARINMNLREGKHWSYGAYTFVSDARGPRPYIVYAPVQTDKTKESLLELQKELRDIVAARPPSDEEVAKVRDTTVRGLPGRWETSAAVEQSLREILQFELPADHYAKYASAVRALKTAEVAARAKELLHADRLVWVVVGDRQKVEAGIRELNLGPLEILEAQ